MTPFRIGMFGGGTVGGGVYELIMNRASTRNVIISHICVRDLNKSRDFKVDESVTSITADAESMIQQVADQQFDCIVEVMGGTGLAKRVVEAGIRSGKPVVTANKALLAEHWTELQQLLAQNPTASIHWEAAVCGGIPIIQVLQTAYTGDVISSLTGICNGTTNYMLTKMSTGTADYADVLQEAQALGYAEADPTADVEGHDVRAKIALLAGQAFGVPVPALDQIPTKGISKVTAADFGYAASMQSTIKLLGTARKSTANPNALSVYVWPSIVHQQQLGSVANCGGAGNIVAVTSQNMGVCTFAGPGAGRFPTANSIVADIYRVVAGAKGSASASDSAAAAALTLDPNFQASFYMRVPLAAAGAPIPVSKTGALAEEHGVPLCSILQKGAANNDFCLTTGACQLEQMKAFSAAVAHQDFCAEEPLFMPILTAPGP